MENSNNDKWKTTPMANVIVPIRDGKWEISPRSEMHEFNLGLFPILASATGFYAMPF